MNAYPPAVFTLTAILCGCGGGAVSEQDARAVAEFVVERGGTLSVDTTGLPVTERNQIPTGPFRILRINLNQKKITDKDLEQLTPLVDLEALELHTTPVTDAGLDAIAQLKGLQELELSLTNVTDKGLEKLAPLTNLKKLYLYNTRVTKEGVEALQEQLTGCTIRY